MRKKVSRITLNQKLMSSQPTIRLPVKRVVEGLVLYPDRSQLKLEYPDLKDEDIRKILDFTTRSLDHEIAVLEAA
ncbi:conserved hypothetical protein [Gammaproteobacteria bacterium]